ncbi:MAG: hypothetical protein V3T16_08155 [Gemmatimonadales bacterium]
MPGTPNLPAPRHYSDDEIALILKRATEMQRAEPNIESPTGLTLAELEGIAVEAGIDPGLLRRAASELDHDGPSTLGSQLAGAPLMIRLERVVPGEFPGSRLDELVPVIQVATAGQGTASAIGQTLTWSSRADNNTSSQQVLVSSKNGETLIRIEERYSGLAGALFGGIVGGFGGGVGLGVGGGVGGAIGSVAFALIWPVVIIAGSYAAARAIFQGQVNKRRRAAEALMNELVERVQHGIGEARAKLESGG